MIVMKKHFNGQWVEARCPYGGKCDAGCPNLARVKRGDEFVCNASLPIPQEITSRLDLKVNFLKAFDVEDRML